MNKFKKVAEAMRVMLEDLFPETLSAYNEVKGS